MISERIFGQGIECARLCVALELLVPRLGVELHEPESELRELVGG